MRGTVSNTLFGILIFGCLAPAEAKTSTPPDPQLTSRRVDELLVQEVHGGDGSKLAKRVDDETFLRRVSLDLVGRIPTPEEITAFALDPDPAKRSRAVKRLLDDPRFGENWAGYWRDAIMYRRTED